MKSGTLIGLGLGIGALVAGVGVFYLQAFAYYQRVDDVTALRIGSGTYPLRAYEGLDNSSLPLRLRGCFQLDDPAAALAAVRAEAPAARTPDPFTAPFWFDCWDAAAIAGDIAAGAAEAFVAETGGAGDFATERVVVLYPDGRGYQWRRLSKDVR